MKKPYGKKFSTGRKVWLVLSMCFFILSVVFSGISFTGNFASEEIGIGKINGYSILFFSLGLFIYLIASYRVKE